MIDPRPFWRRRLLRPFLGLLALNALVLLAYTLPRSLQERNRAARAVTLRAEVEREARQVAELRRVADTVRANTRDLERFYRETVGTRVVGFVSLLEDIQKMAAEPGLQAGSRSYSREEVDGAPLVRVEIRVPLEGTYKQLVGFLDRVERSKRFLTVEQVQLRGKGRAEEPGRAALNVGLSTYLREEPGQETGGKRGR